MRSRRLILLLDLRYDGEREVFGTIKAAPAGEGAAFVRAMMLMGFKEIQREKARSQPEESHVKGIPDET